LLKKKLQAGKQNQAFGVTPTVAMPHTADTMLVQTGVGFVFGNLTIDLRAIKEFPKVTCRNSGKI
jgi:uncharacterized membrane protein SirB2